MPSMYELIARDLREQILSGRLTDQLPTREALCDRYDVSVITVRDALRMLAREGLVDIVAGHGTFVRTVRRLVRESARHYSTRKPRGFAADADHASRTAEFTFETVRTRPTRETAKRLGIPRAGDVISTQYVSFADGVPVMLVTSHERYDIVKGTPIERPQEGPLAGEGLVVRYASIGKPVTHVDEALHVRMPRPSEAEALALGSGVPVILIERTTFAGELVIEVAELLLKGDAYELRYRLIPGA